MNESGAPGEIRTPDPLLRRQMLYPAELRARRITLPNSALETPEFEVAILIAAKYLVTKHAATLSRPSASKVRRGGLYPAELRTRWPHGF